MTTIHRLADGKKVAFVKGAPEIILEKCSFIQEDDGRRIMGEEKKRRFSW